MEDREILEMNQLLGLDNTSPKITTKRLRELD